MHATLLTLEVDHATNNDGLCHAMPGSKVIWSSSRTKVPRLGPMTKLLVQGPGLDLGPMTKVQELRPWSQTKDLASWARSHQD